MQHGFQHRAAERLLGLRQPAEVFESAAHLETDHRFTAAGQGSPQ